MKQTLLKLTPEELKLIQQKSLEIAEYVVGFCKQNNLRVYLFAGSLLGAVREKGFIPWDDDMDLIMPAPDYKKFIEIWNEKADTEKYSLCIQTETYNDHTLSGSIRDNNTTFITDSTVGLDVNQGLSVDFGCVRACPDSWVGQQFQLICASARSLFKAGRVPARQGKLIKMIATILLGIFRGRKVQYFIWSNLEKMATVADSHYEQAKYVRELSMFPFITWLYPREWFEEAVWVPFENTMMPIPIGAKEYLTKRYGNYMELPPEKDRHPEHRIVFMDLDTPYKEYRGKKYFVDK